MRSLASSPSGSFDLMGGAVGIGECLGTLLRLLPVVVTDYATDEVGGRLPPLCLPCFPATSVKGSSAAIRLAQALSEAWDILLNKDPALLDHLQRATFVARAQRARLCHSVRRFTRALRSHAATLYSGRTTRPRRRTALALTVAAALESARMARGCGPAALGVCLLYPDRTHAFSNTAREARLRRVAAASPQALSFRVIGSQRLALSTPQCTGCGLHGGRCARWGRRLAGARIHADATAAAVRR